MKKIEKFVWDKDPLIVTRDEMIIGMKINEIIENQNLIVDRLNQEVSQPEDNLTPKEYIVKNAESLGLNGERFYSKLKKVKNNTEEWEDRSKTYWNKLSNI